MEADGYVGGAGGDLGFEVGRGADGEGVFFAGAIEVGGAAVFVGDEAG